MIRNIGVNTHNLTLDTIFNNIGVSNQLTKGVVMNEEQFAQEITDVVLKNEELIKEVASLKTNVDDLLRINSDCRYRIKQLEDKIRGSIPESIAPDVLDIVLAVNVVLYGSDDECDIILSDLNNDSEINVLDIVTLVGMILSNEYSEAADINDDLEINVIDVVQLVNIILN